MAQALKWYQYKDEEGNIRLNMDRILKRALIVVLIVFSMITSAVFLLSYWGPPIIMPANEIGDTFGIANALFSALAFSLLIYTSLLQREELKLQREEIAKNREEFQKTAEAQQKMVEFTEIMHSGDLYPQLSVAVTGQQADLLTVSFSNRSNLWLTLRDIRDTNGRRLATRNINENEIQPAGNVEIQFRRNAFDQNAEYILYYHSNNVLFSRSLGAGSQLRTTGIVSRVSE